jgi:hypothetical protein
MLRRTLTILIGALSLATILPAHAIGDRVDVQIVDRTTGEVIKPIYHNGEWWIAGKPGTKYGVTLLNRNGHRTLDVVSIDGVNAISGDTASWSQTGYVIDAYERNQIDGWRKNIDQVAAFEFAALSDSYAARTGRPGNVGVIGVAIFDERPRFVPAQGAKALGESNGDTMRRTAPSAPPAPMTQAPMPAPAPSSDATTGAPSRARPAEPEALAQRDRLGTAHGEIEQSSIRYVSFQRAQSTPNEIVTIHYDRMENLIAMGIVPAPMPPVAVNPAVNPFPGSRRFVPDPPPR